MRNLFSFGCSFTSFKYPTYVDYLSPYFDQTYNYGRPGSGNKSIFNKIVRLIYEKKIKKNDYVTIQWSSLAREDIMINNGWDSGGLITNSPLFDNHYIQKYFSVNQKGNELLSYIVALLSLLKSEGINFKWFYMLEPWISNVMGEPGEIPNELIKKYKEASESGVLEDLKMVVDENYINSIESFILNSDIDFREKLTYYYENENHIHGDDHPSPYCHFLFSKYVLNSFDLKNDLFDDMLYKNSVDWTSYITNKNEIFKIESDFNKNYGRRINYINNEHPYLRWPSKIQDFL